MQIFFRKYTAKNNSRTLNYYYFYHFLAPLCLVWDPYTATRDRNLDSVVETGFMSLYLADFARLNQIFTKYLYRLNRACRIFFSFLSNYIHFSFFRSSPRMLVENTVGGKKRVLREKKKTYASMWFKFMKKKSACVVSFSSEKKLGGCSFIWTDDMGKNRETMD